MTSSIAQSTSKMSRRDRMKEHDPEIEVAALCGLSLVMGPTLWALDRLLNEPSVWSLTVTLLLVVLAAVSSVAPQLSHRISGRYSLSRAILVFLTIAVWTFTRQAAEGLAWALTLLSGTVAIGSFAAMGIVRAKRFGLRGASEAELPSDDETYSHIRPSPRGP